MLFHPGARPRRAPFTDGSPMKTSIALPCLLSALVSLVAASARPQEPKKQEPKKKPGEAISRFFESEVERLTTEVEGSWMLMDYTDPSDLALEDVASGFATFHDGFLTLLLAMETVETRFFRTRATLMLDAGAWRYRFDEQGNLQIANVLSYTNQTDYGDVELQPSGQVYEYFAKLEDGVLELRDPDGITLSFRKVAAGEFPDLASRKLDHRRSGTPQWEEEDETPR